MTSTESPPPSVDVEVLERVLEAHPVRLAVLFGSTTDGSATPASDVDIAVEFESEDVALPRRHRARATLVADLAEALGTDDVDVADLDTVRPAVGAAALGSGILLVGDEDRAVSLREHFEERTETETHEDRLQRFDAIVDRLKETMS